MKRWLFWMGVIAAGFSTFASAQQWFAYVPPERDFRVLMPSAPARSITREGSVEYKAEANRLEYLVYRHDPRRLADVQSVREDIIKRITRGDETIRGIGENEGDLAPTEFIFKAGGAYTMHRVFTEGGVYYELVVKSTDEDSGVNRQLARDYFSSFNVARGASFASFMAIPAPETCATRSHSIARTICQYVSCMQPANAAHPVCVGLPRLLR